MKRKDAGLTDDKAGSSFTGKSRIGAVDFVWKWAPEGNSRIKIIQESGLPYEFRSMGTSIDGEWEEVMAVVKRCFEAMRQDCKRVVLSLKADYRRGPSGRMQRKVESVLGKILTASHKGQFLRCASTASFTMRRITLHV